MKLSTLAGFALAGFLFFAWYANRNQNNTSTPLENKLLDQNGVAEARMDAGAYDTRSLSEPEAVSKRKRSSNEPLAIVAEPTSKATRTKFSSEIGKLAKVAIAGAIDRKKSVPAGTSLALLIYQAERGKQFTTSNLRTVIAYLESIKQNANAQDSKRFFKYSSNSEKWFQGLELDQNGGHPVADLQRIYRQYHLQQYDKNAYAAITGETTAMRIDERIEPETELPVMDGDPSENEVRRNHASAMNRWAEKESRGTKAAAKFLPASDMDKHEVNEVRNEVEGLRIGQSMTFDDPDTYHAAVKEMIAMENDCDSWAAYEKKQGKDKAKRTFRKRAEKGGIMATGTLKVTRER